jgi:hypothetical protein
MPGRFEAVYSSEALEIWCPYDIAADQFVEYRRRILTIMATRDTQYNPSVFRFQSPFIGTADNEGILLFLSERVRNHRFLKLPVDPSMLFKSVLTFFLFTNELWHSIWMEKGKNSGNDSPSFASKGWFFEKHAFILERQQAVPGFRDSRNANLLGLRGKQGESIRSKNHHRDPGQTSRSGQPFPTSMHPVHRSTNRQT